MLLPPYFFLHYNSKKLLATYLSQNLATFCHVNPDQVQSTLVQNAKVVLNNVEIKERCFFFAAAADDDDDDRDKGRGDGNVTHHLLKVYGSIDQMEFAWVWDASSSFVKDVNLIVRGAHVHVDNIIAANESNRHGDDDAMREEETSETRSISTSNKAKENTPEGDSNWKANYLQQFLDHLTLIVTDVRIYIHTRSSDYQQQFRKDVVVLQMKDAELKSIQSGSSNSESYTGENHKEDEDKIDNEAALIQMVSIATVEAWLAKEQDGSDDDAERKTKKKNAPFHEVNGLGASMDSTIGLIRDNSLVIEVIEMQLDLSDFRNSPILGGEKCNANISIPFPIGLTVSTFSCKSNEFDVRYEKLSINYAPFPRRSIYIHCDRVTENKIISLNGLGLDLNLIFSEEKSKTQNSTIPGLDAIEKASLKVADIDMLVMEGKGKLLSPLKNTTITYQDGVLATEFDSMQFACWIYQGNQRVFIEKLSLRVQYDSINAKFGRITTEGGIVSFNALRTSLIARLSPSRAEEPLAVGMCPFIALDVTAIDSLRIHTSSFKSPGISRLTVRFENDVLSCHIPYLYLRRDNGNGKKVSSTSIASEILAPPCQTKLSVDSLHLVDSKEENQTIQSLQETRCQYLTLVLDPVIFGADKQSQPIDMTVISFQATCNDFETIYSIKTAINIPSISVSGLLRPNDVDKICNLAVGIEKAQLAAELSSSEWAESLEDDKVAVRLPFTSIPKFKLTLRFVGPLIKLDDATIACDEFIGSQDTTLGSIKNHYIGIVQKRIPYLVAKIDLAGANVADSAAIFAATVLTRTTVIGSTVGVASRDMIGSTITTGKVLRGAEASDKYQFGDFARGLTSSIKSATRSGSIMRGCNSDSYQFGDFAAGTAKAAGEYALGNRERLATVGGSTMLVVAGAAFLGPGIVSGGLLGLIGGTVAKSIMRAVGGDQKINALKGDASQPCTSTQQHILPPEIFTFDNNSNML